MKRSSLCLVHDAIIRSWDDPLYKQKFLEKPHWVLDEGGVNFDSETNINIYENSETDLHIVISIKPASYDSLSLEEKEAAVATAIGESHIFTLPTC